MLRPKHHINISLQKETNQNYHFQLIRDYLALQYPATISKTSKENYTKSHSARFYTAKPKSRPRVCFVFVLELVNCMLRLKHSSAFQNPQTILMSKASKDNYKRKLNNQLSLLSRFGVTAPPHQFLPI